MASALITRRAIVGSVSLACLSHGFSPSAALSQSSKTRPVPRAGLALAQDFRDGLTLGVNIERSRAWEMPITASYLETYLKNTIGMTHIRLFYPWRPTMQMYDTPVGQRPAPHQFDRLLDVVERVNAAGIKVILDCTDVMGYEDFAGSYQRLVDDHIRMCAAAIASRNFHPLMAAFGPVNEWAGGDNATFHPHRLRLHQLMRTALPNHVLQTGGCNWKYFSNFTDPSQGFVPFDDMQVLYEWHSYDDRGRADWSRQNDAILKWSLNNAGRPTYAGEVGAGGGNSGGNWQRWAVNIQEQLPSLAAQRPTYWAITNGDKQQWQLNKGWSDPTFYDGSLGWGEPDLKSLFTVKAAHVRAALNVPPKKP